MNRVLTNRLTLALVTLAVAGLASAVFLWGLAYRISLYPHKPRTSVPIARLLSERERSAAGLEGLVRTGAPVNAGFFSLALLALARREGGEFFSLGILEKSASTHRTPCLIYVRPPPRTAT